MIRIWILLIVAIGGTSAQESGVRYVADIIDAYAVGPDAMTMKNLATALRSNEVSLDTAERVLRIRQYIRVADAPQDEVIAEPQEQTPEAALQAMDDLLDGSPKEVAVSKEVVPATNKPNSELAVVSTADLLEQDLPPVPPTVKNQKGETVFMVFESKVLATREKNNQTTWVSLDNTGHQKITRGMYLRISIENVEMVTVMVWEVVDGFARCIIMEDTWAEGQTTRILPKKPIMCVSVATP